VTASPDRTAVVRRVLPAPPSDVYDAWLDPEALADFICPHPASAGPIQVDPRVGGRLSIVMIDTDVVVTITGEYLELDRPNRLRFTWDSDLGDRFTSIVTVTIEPHGEHQALMTIEHAQLPPEWRGEHEHGWTLIAAQLEHELGVAD
jgi:uncharacterized protein YndB with AHSA1/START domain